MPKFLRKKPTRHIEKGSTVVEPRSYIDLNEFDVGVEATATGPVVRVAEVYRYEDVTSLTDFVYNGDVLIIDFSSIANDELTLRRIINELKNVARDINGDVAGIGKTLIMVTPTGMKISRRKIKGGMR